VKEQVLRELLRTNMPHDLREPMLHRHDYTNMDMTR